MAQGNGLHQDIAHGRGLDRAGEHGAAGGVGGELREQAVLRAAADDVDRLQPVAEDLLQPSPARSDT